MRRAHAAARHPALHFVVLGGIAFALSCWMPAPVEPAAGAPRSDEELLLELVPDREVDPEEPVSD